VDILDKIIIPLLGAVGGGVGAYAAIRSDLASLKAQMAIYAQSLSRAHERIDAMMGRK